MVILFLCGFCISGQVLVYPIATESNSSKIAGTVNGVINMFGMGICAIGAPIIGVFMDYLWDGGYDLASHRIYSLLNYRYAFSLVLVGIGMAFLLTLFLPETYPKNKRK